MHVMLDLETLGTRPNATIIQIGAVLFEAKSGGKVLNGEFSGFNRYVRVQDGAGTIDHGTIAFWLQDPSAAKMGAALEKDSVQLAQALQEFVAWPHKVCGSPWSEIEGVWADPADFDLPILKHAFSIMGADAPWDRRATRDARTVYGLVGGKPDIDWSGLTAHDALDDALGQIMQLQKAFEILGR